MMFGPSVGSIFRERREELGISVEMAATATNVRARVLQVLEENDFHNYPPYGHAMGILSSYARYLKLDPRPILAQFDQEWTEFEKQNEIAKSAEHTRRGVGRFGERVPADAKPLPRDARGEGKASRVFRRSDEVDQNAIDEKLANEQIAEGDNRYVSGSVKVVGTRQTGSFDMVGIYKPRRTREAGDANDGAGRTGRTGRIRSRSDEPSRSSETRSHAPYSGGMSGRLPRMSDTPRGARTGREQRARRERNAAADRFSSTYGSGSFSPVLDEVDGTGSMRRVSDTGVAEGSRSRRRGEAGASHERRRGEDLPSRFDMPKDRFAQERGSASSSRRHRSRRAPIEPRGNEASADGNIFERVVSLVGSALSEKRTRIIVLCAAVFVLVVVSVAAVLISTAGNSGTNDVIQVEGGAADTTSTKNDPKSASATVTTTNGNPIDVRIEVAEGQTSLINVTYDDDNAYSGTAVGAWDRSFLVTESLTATFGNPDAVTVTQNGNKCDIQKGDDGTGTLSITVKTTSTSASDSDKSTSSKSSSSSKKKQS